MSHTFYPVFLPFLNKGTKFSTNRYKCCPGHSFNIDETIAIGNLFCLKLGNKYHLLQL